jgi:polysaccharide deacetylase 2 family uncharacterized protein YibQ
MFAHTPTTRGVTVRNIGILIALLFPFNTLAQQQEVAAQDSVPRIAIIIDDMGNRLEHGNRAIALPGPVTVNILPFTPHARYFAEQAKKARKEIMLHIPMEANSDRYLGAGGLHSGMSRNEFNHILNRNLDWIPGIKGVSNHMGSRLTQNKIMMGWFMTGLASYGDLYFVDSRTTANSVAVDFARKNQLPHAERDVFLDHEQTMQHVQQQWTRMLRTARRNGSVLAIGHPYAVTIQFLEKHLPGLEAQGYKLVSVSELLQWRQTRRNYAWQTSSFRLHRAAKNSKQ